MSLYDHEKIYSQYSIEIAQKVILSYIDVLDEWYIC